MKLAYALSTTEQLLQRLLHHPLPEIDLSLARLERFMERIGNPHLRLPPVIHVAGTNGKGSLIAYLRSILTEGGYSCHVYTSPHLVRFHERIVLAGREIEDDALRPLLAEVLEASEEFPITFFEAATAAALLAFARNPADIVLLEVGMGGRYDATNLIEAPALTAITPVSFDHTEFLGDTLGKIAYEKAGIIKRGVPCVIGPQETEARECLLSVGAEQGATLYMYGKEWCLNGDNYSSRAGEIGPLRPSLPGEFQLRNAATALACMEVLRQRFPVASHMALAGIAGAVWPARLQRLEEGTLVALLAGTRQLWLDGGHNPSAGEAIAGWLRAREEKVHLIIGMLADKDAHGYLAPLAPYLASVTAVEIPDEKKSANANDLVGIARNIGLECRSLPSVEEALRDKARHSDAAGVLIGGSLYLAGYVLAKNQHA